MGAFLNPLGTLHRIVGIGMLISLLLLGAWAKRLDHLREGWQTLSYALMVPLEEANGLKPGSANPKKDGHRLIIRLRTSRDEWKDAAGQYERERDNAREVVKVQGDSILDYERETKRLRHISEERRSLAAKLIADRNTWIARAKTASTRTEAMAAEEEVKATEETLDALYNAGF